GGKDKCQELFIVINQQLDLSLVL
ncbi:MAG: hypothetical protein RIS93_427, partial [Actinomycetota bacterium]